MAQTELSKAIKKLNQRIVDFNKRGLTESIEYDRIITSIHRLGATIKETKSGNPSIKNSNKYDDETVEKILKLANTSKSTAGATSKRAKEYIAQNPEAFERFDLSDKQQLQTAVRLIAKKSKDVHDFINDKSNQSYIYNIDKLNNAVHRSDKLTWDEVDDLLNMYETHKEEIGEIDAQNIGVQPRDIFNK